MRVRGTGGRMLLIGSLLAFSLPLTARTAAASGTSRSAHPAGHGAPHANKFAAARPEREISYARSATFHYVHGRLMPTRNAVYYARGGHSHWGGISCVPYARSVSGIDVPGNAWQWWDNAAGRYARGNQPEPGSVLSFTSNGRMRLGHVAVVSRVVNPREIEVDQANWWGPGARGGVSHDIPVVDVSENNDWTAVRVGLGNSGEFGSVYPTNGFIYNRPDDGRMVTAVITPAPAPVLNPAPSDLRPWAQRVDSTAYDEVAEAPPVHAAVRHHAAHRRPAAQH